MAADLDEFEPRPAPGAPAAELPGFDGEARGAAGIHGVPRRRQWDAVTTADAPGLHGDTVEFAAVRGRKLISPDGLPSAALQPLADALGRRIEPPYRAEAVRRSGSDWAVAARRIEVVALPGLTGDEAELAVTGEDRVLRVDGRPTLERAPALERAGERRGSEYVVRARRIDGDLWEVEASAL
jgi:hypothetical protein